MRDHSSAVRAANPPRSQSRVAPGTPASNITTGSDRSALVKYAGGSHTHAARAWKCETRPGITIWVTTPMSDRTRTAAAAGTHTPRAGTNPNDATWPG